MTARRPKPKPPATTGLPIYDAVCADLGQPGLSGRTRQAVVLSKAMLPSLHQTDGKSALEPLP